MYNIGIIGIGFLGGSLAKSLAKSTKVNKILAIDKNIESFDPTMWENICTENKDEIIK